jgi:DNA replication protein DnaC
MKIGEQQKAMCDIHGEYLATMFCGRMTSCPKCAAAEFEKLETERIKSMTIGQNPMIEWRKRVIENNLGRASIPERFKDKTLVNYTVENEGQQKALDFAVKFVDDYAEGKRGQSAIFTGERGTGKTHIAVGIAHRLIVKNDATAVFVTVQRLIRAIRETWRRDSEKTESEVIAVYADPDLLILDEVGVQAGSENEKQILFDLLNERYERRKSTIMLTNLSVEESKEFLGERVFDRLREDGGKFIPFKWDSYRGKA